ncbi:MAG: DUF4450 domain-containing protein [Armatimonadetes bacterium]|nr:DUF4450 domain-containing protein [Armatimonadota bacterium]
MTFAQRDGFVQDAFRRQEWPVRGLTGIQEYSIREGAFCIREGAHTFNRPLYGPPGPILPFAGDRPQWLLAEIGRSKLGILSLAITNRWLHEATAVESAYDAGRMRQVLGDPALGDPLLTITTLRLAETPGFILRLEATGPLAVRWVFGGLRAGFDTDWAGSGGWPGGLHAEDAAGNRVLLGEGVACLSTPDVPDRVVTVATSGEPPRLVALAEADPEVLFAAAPDERPGVGGVLHLDGSPAFLVVAAVAPDAEPAGLPPIQAGEQVFRQAEECWRARAERLAVCTPVPELDAAVRSNNAALDGLWRPPSFLGGTVRGATEGWPLGWRGWYGPICAGDHERVRQAIRFHADHAVEEPATGIQSRGAFCSFIRFDGHAEPGSYDMNQGFLDQIRYYYAWTGDLETVRAVWPALRRCLEYERRESDPDGDGLYANRQNTWVSAGRPPGSGGGTQASAYLYRAHCFAAAVAERLGEDPSPYRDEAARIRAAVQAHLWMERPGHFAEYLDPDGALHTAAEAASIYLPVTLGLAEPLPAIRATEYLTRRLWRFGDQILTNDWFPVSATNGCLAHHETLHAALAYFHAGDAGRGWRLLQTVTRAFCRAVVPGSLSGYAGRDGAQGDDVEFADAVSLFARCVVEGLFGLEPDVPAGRLSWTPRFPPEWPRASLHTAGYTLAYQRSGTRERYTLALPNDLAATLHLPLRFDRLKRVTLDGRPISYQGEPGLDQQRIVLRLPPARRAVVELVYSNRARARVSDPPAWAVAGESVALATTAGSIAGVEDPEGALKGVRLTGSRLEARAGRLGQHTFYARLKLPHAEVIHPVPLEVRPAFELLDAQLLASAACPGEAFLEVTLRANKPERVPPPFEVLYAGRTYRGRLGAAGPGGRAASERPGEPATFRFAVKNPERLSPGGIPLRVTIRAAAGPVVLTGETRLWSLFQAWLEAGEAFAARCRPLAIPRNARLDALFNRHDEDTGLPLLNGGTGRDTGSPNLEHVAACLREGVFRSAVGVPFQIPAEGENLLCLSRERSHPAAVEIPVGGQAETLYLLLANVTRDSQTHRAQARVHLEYADGEQEQIDLRGPEVIDHLLQHYAARAYPQWVGGERDGYYGPGPATGTHADVVDLHPGRREPIARLRLECLTRETLIGVLGVTLLSPP